MLQCPIFMPEQILSVHDLQKTYGKLEAVRGISFSLEPGEIVGLLGPNGSGKTTTINMILGLLEPSGGEVTIFGKNFREHREEILRRMNFAAVYAHLPGHLPVGRNLYIFALLYGVAHPDKKIAELLEEFDLVPFAGTRAGFLSSGEQTRLALAKAFLNEPALLLLDEPTASLDPSTSKMIRGKIKEYAQERQAAVLWTSHDMHEVEEACGRVLFISHGKILLEGDPRALPAKYGKKDLEELFIAVAREPLNVVETL